MGDNVNSRQRLKPWLESKIDSRTIPGLCWLDRSKKKFRIPWKRNGTTEWEKEDSAIFRDWAIHTGKYREGIDKIDYPYWKTRLRCALTKHPEIIECKEDYLPHGNDPYRVYRIEDSSPCEEIRLPTCDVAMEEDIPGETMEIDVMDSDLRNISNSELIKLSPAEALRLQHSLEAERRRYEEAVRLSFYFEVIINFQYKEVSKTLVKQCCFLTTKDYDSFQQMQNYCAVISFPNPPEAEQVQMITSVLWPNLKDGIYLRFDENKNIFAKRLCKCRIYYRNQNNQDGMKLDRADSWSLIFDYQKFCEDFERGVESISANTILYIGQRYDPDPIKVFFSVTICHLEAKQKLNSKLLEVHKVSMSI